MARNREQMKKHTATARILWGGFLIICLCIGICISLVQSLQDTYRREISEEFQTQHVTTGKALERVLKETGNSIKTVASVIGWGNISEQAFLGLMSDNLAYHFYEHIYYHEVGGDTWVDGVKESLPDIKSVEALLERLPYDEDGVYIGEVGGAINLLTDSYLVTAAGVYSDGRLKGYVFAPINARKLFASETFAYQVMMGECLLIDQTGAILGYSEGSAVVTMNHETFQLGVLAYSREGDEISKRAIQEFNTGLYRGESGFVTVITHDGYRMQISYSPVQDTNDLFFVSCYSDNLVDGRIQPLIFRSVLSCITIIVLMIVAVTYVWVTAKKTNITVERLAYEDPVTKGKNLNYFREAALHTILTAKETPFAIFRFDISHFRYINESFGHQRADQVLVSCIRNFERIFSEKELCVRMGSDQFLALVENDPWLDKRLEEFVLSVNADAKGNNIKFPIRFKTGIYQIKKHDHDIDVMIDHANVARKTLDMPGRDNKSGRVLYTDSIVDEMRKVDHIESQMQKALAAGEFKVYLQPKWDIFENRITGAEALVRWIRADGTMVLPDRFIPVFEKNGFVEQLDFYMLEMVCQRMRELIDEGIQVLPVSVNQSRLLLHSPDYVENVEKILTQYHIPEGLIELEITESVFEEERSDMIRIVHKLKEKGVRLDMDDFGSGYSSLSMVTEVPYDVIKIDRAFFTHMEERQESRWVLQKVVEMMHGMGMEVVCEGVETDAQVVFLKEIGCRKVQGYYYSRPIAEPEFIKKYYKTDSNGKQ
ncbi:MAG: EAL domain-containing protein [Lachnospiraceae bacterium]|nr:EAL domain-containing protein [Lachnospiraceae bacterium]